MEDLNPRTPGEMKQAGREEVSTGRRRATRTPATPTHERRIH